MVQFLHAVSPVTDLPLPVSIAAGVALLIGVDVTAWRLLRKRR